LSGTAAKNQQSVTVMYSMTVRALMG